MDPERENYAEPSQPPPIWGPQARRTVVEILIALAIVGAIQVSVALWLTWSGHQPR